MGRLYIQIGRLALFQELNSCRKNVQYDFYTNDPPPGFVNFGCVTIFLPVFLVVVLGYGRDQGGRRDSQEKHLLKKSGYFNSRLFFVFLRTGVSISPPTGWSAGASGSTVASIDAIS